MDKLLMTETIKKFLRYSEVQIDNFVFRLHHQFTVVLLLGCSALVTATQLVGDPMLCASQDIHPKETLNTYCWVESTITLPRSLNGTLGLEVAAPGVDQHRIREDDPVIEHTYYQWVALFLFFQAFAFYFPKWLWEIWEHGRMETLIGDLKNPAISEKKRNKQIEKIATYFREYSFEIQQYAYRFFWCEILNFVNVMFQLWLLDRFLGHQFWTYGPAAVAFLFEEPEDRVDPMSRVFPKMSKCRLRRFGTSGEVQIHDTICVLPINILNEKIFVFLWFWLTFLAAASFGNLIYRAIMIKSPTYRTKTLTKLSTVISKKDLEKVQKQGKYGDWFMVHLLKDNVRAPHFKQVVCTVCDEVDSRGKKAGSHPHGKGEDEKKLIEKELPV